MKNERMKKHVRQSLTAFLTLIFSYGIAFAAKTESTYKIPDFAFPQKVESRSDSLLRESLASYNDVMALRALINDCIAFNLLSDGDSPARNVSLIDSVTNLLSDTYKPLGYLLEAEILQQEYMSKRGIYNSRKLPETSNLPADPKEWDGDMYRSKIYDLICRATNKTELQGSIPIEKISILVNISAETKKINLTLRDFIILKGQQVLKSIGNGNEETIIPFNKGTELSFSDKCQEKAKELLDVLIAGDESSGNSITSAIAVMEYYGWLNDSAGKAYLEEKIKEFKNKEGEGLLLYAAASRNTDPSSPDTKVWYGLLNEWLKKYPKSILAPNLRYLISLMEQKKIEVELPKLSVAASDIPVNVNMTNIKKGYLLVYRVPASQADNHDGLIFKKFTPSSPVASIEVACDGQTPFSVQEKKMISGLNPGLYVVIPSTGKKLDKNWNSSGNRSYSTFRVTDISILTSFDGNEKDSGRLYVVDSSTQQPLEGATVKLYENYSDKITATLTTGKDGSVEVPSGYYRIEAEYKGSMARTGAGFSYYPEHKNKYPRASFFTDLSLYRPGDTVRFAVVGWNECLAEKSLMKNGDLRISLRDANYQEVDTLKVKLDGYGRGSGEFKIPEGRMLGTYRLIASLPSEAYNNCGVIDFEVSDYKLPEFSVVLQQVKGEEEIPAELNFKGEAMTFTGMPVANSPVAITVEYLPWYGFRGISSPASYDTSTFTSADGTFDITLPLAGLKGTRFEEGRYKISARVASSSGDSQEGSMFFFLGKSTTLRPSVPDKIKIESDSVKLYVPAYNIEGLPEKVTACYTFTDIENPEHSLTGTFVTPDLLIPADIKAGNYKISFSLPEGGEEISTETVFYYADDPRVPYKTSLWIPENEYEYNQDDKELEVKFGSAWAGNYLLCILSDSNGIISRQWVVADSCINSLKVKLPDNKEVLFINLAGMHDFKSRTGQIKLIPAKSLEKMEIQTVSFRDNITAGDKETWRFKFSINEKGADNVAAFAVMTDKALNEIRGFKWNFNIGHYFPYSKTHIGSSRQSTLVTWRNFGGMNIYPKSFNFIPTWDTYNYPLLSSGMIVRNAVMHKMLAKSDAASSRSYTTDFGVMEEAYDEAIVEAPAMATGEAGPSLETDNIALRPVEMPVAFFNPGLTGDEEGNIEVEFSVPDFNTTWQFQIAGYNEELLNATLQLDALAAKPVMAKANLPQYLRTGDKAEISALIYNNSPENQMLAGKIEVINPLTGEKLKSADFKQSLVTPSGSKLISIAFDVPDDASVLAVRVYGMSGSHSDGEEGYIKILPSSTPVVESTVFYLDSKEETTTLTLPKLKSDANVTLKYCDNPLWEVMLSLPSLQNADDRSSLSVTGNLFATLAGRDILTSNPEVATGLSNILNSHDENLTKSNLEKDEALKIVGLQMTPWVNDALAQTMRIRSLSYLLDESKVSAKADNLMKSLGALQNPDGGWSWFEGFKSSPYITSEIIGMLGWLNQYGLLNEETNKMAASAISYYDNYLLQQKTQGIKFNNSSALGYFYKRSFFDLSESKGIKNIEKETIEAVKKDWRHFSLQQKSKAAILLFRKGDGEARTIISSLAEFTERQHTLADLSLMLEAFAVTGYSPAGLDNTRKLLFLKKETQDWGDNLYNASMIHSLIVSTPKEIVNKPMPQIVVGGKKLDITSEQQLIGSYTINLDPKKVSGKKLVITRSGGIPAWGGVVSQQILPIKEVKSSKVENLSVEKKIYVVDENGKMKETSKLKKGDNVIVSLQLSCGKDMEYVALTDLRGACLQPVSRVSGVTNVDGLYAYREIRYDRTSFFIERLPAGKYIISYECTVDRDGEYSLGIVSVQSLYSPIETAHSAGDELKVGSK